MYNTIKTLYIAFILLLSTGMVRAQYSGGTGTINDPYQIASLDDLHTFSSSPDDWDKHFILSADIDASDTQNWNDGNGFSPVGNYDNPFTGSLDGREHNISGLYISRINSYYVGLFGMILTGDVKNLNLINFNVEGGFNVGSLAGVIGYISADTSKINYISCENCSVSGGGKIGGLAGEVYSAIISNCYFEGFVSGEISIIGGLIGQTNNGNGSAINNCDITVNIAGPAYTGGLVGINQIPVTDCHITIHLEDINGAYYGFYGGLAATNISLISDCSVNGEIFINNETNDYIGGLTGSNDGIIKDCDVHANISAGKSLYAGGITGKNEKQIKNSYTTGEVSGKKAVGGLAGITTDNSLINNCYTTGMVTGEDKTGGLVGENSYFATVTNCYASGPVNSDAWFSGGFVGLNRSTAHTFNCFFDKETTGKENGIGMDQNGQNQQVTDLTSYEFMNQTVFEEATWRFGNTSVSPWKMGTAPDGKKRPVLYYQNYTVTFLADTGGQLLPENNRVQTINCDNNSDTILAVPDQHYVFKKWQTVNGDSITNINSLFISNVISDTTLVAVFQFTDDIEEYKAGHVEIYPNPVKTSAVINYVLPTGIYEGEIKIHSISGRTVFRKILKQRDGRIIFNARNLPADLYIYTLKTSTSVLTGKIVVSK